jgi:hypothetical protein
MKLARLLGLTVILTGLVFTAFATVNSGAEDRIQYEEDKMRFVKVTRPFTNVYVELDPKSSIIRQTRKSEYLELLAIGLEGSWYKVKVDGRDGWLESRAGRVVDRKSAPVVTFLLTVFVLGGGAVAVVFFLRKQKIKAETSEGDADPDSLPDIDDDDELA